jgi:alpha-beta hydrolase superfamily lysophospholipase
MSTSETDTDQTASSGPPAAGPTITHSADGTAIAYEAYGTGPIALVVGGAFCDRGAFRELAEALGKHGLTGVTYDRRGRGDSGDTKPYAVEREIEDLTAVIEAIGGPGATAHAHGISSGGALVLRALAKGAPIATASMVEPPYRVEGAPPGPEDYIGTLERLEAAADREGILRYFHTRAVGLPEEMIDGMKGSPMWEALLGMTYTVRYDGLCMGEGSAIPTELLAGITAPVLVVSSIGTAIPFLPAAARAVAEALPNGSYRELEGGFHEVPKESMANAIAELAGPAS